MHKLQKCKINFKISQQVCISVQSGGRPGARSAGSLLPSSPLHLSQKQATMPEEETSWTAEHLLLSDLAWSICSWAENAPVSMVHKELIPHPCPAEAWIPSQAAADEMSIPLHRASRVCPTLCQTTTRAFSSLHSDGKRKDETNCYIRERVGTAPSWEGGNVEPSVWVSNYSYQCLDILGK